MAQTILHFPFFILHSKGACGCFSGNGNTVVFGCSPACTCGGNCLAVGAFNVEHAIFAVTGGVCRCGMVDPDMDAPPVHYPADGPSIVIMFSKDAVLFEDSYQDSPGDLKPKRSTRVRLTISAYGGTLGGSMVIAHQNMGKISAVAGGNIELPPTKELAAGESFYSTCVYEGKEPSQALGDVMVSGYIVETVSGTRINSSSQLTVVQVEIKPKDEPPQNPSPNRHACGVHEWVGCSHRPTAANVVWGDNDNGDTITFYPNNSSYIEVEEIPETEVVPSTGYFVAMPGVLPLTHDESAGAGIWHRPWPRNGGIYWTDDAAQMPRECPPITGTEPASWSIGTMRWLIPIGWGDGSQVMGRIVPNPTDQVYTMSADGKLSITKYGHTISRSVDNKVWLDGKRVNAWWNR